MLEEAAYCDPGLVNEVVVPLLSMQSCVLLCISTLLDGANHYSSCRTRCLAPFPPPSPSCFGPRSCLTCRDPCAAVCALFAGKMINLRDEHGAKVFESLQISLVCGMLPSNRPPNPLKSCTPLLGSFVDNPLTACCTLWCIFQTRVSRRNTLKMYV